MTDGEAGRLDGGWRHDGSWHQRTEEATWQVATAQPSSAIDYAGDWWQAHEPQERPWQDQQWHQPLDARAWWMQWSGDTYTDEWASSEWQNVATSSQNPTWQGHGWWQRQSYKERYLCEHILGVAPVKPARASRSTSLCQLIERCMRESRTLQCPQNRSLTHYELPDYLPCRYEPANAGRLPCNGSSHAASQCHPCPTDTEIEGTTHIVHNSRHYADPSPVLTRECQEHLREKDGTSPEGQRHAPHGRADVLPMTRHREDDQQNSRLPVSSLTPFSYDCKRQQLAQKQNTDNQGQGFPLLVDPWNQRCSRSLERGKRKQGKKHGRQGTLHQNRKGSPPRVAMQVWSHQLVVDACMPPMRQRPHGQGDSHAQPTGSTQWCTDWPRNASAAHRCGIRWLNREQAQRPMLRARQLQRHHGQVGTKQHRNQQLQH